MAQHNQTGKEGEELAVKYMLENGYEILNRNWKYMQYEIDIIAKKGKTLCIVEVKTRTGNFFGEPEEGVSNKKIRFLAHAADYYIQSKDINMECRYDIVSITMFNGRHELKYIEDAFYPYMWRGLKTE